MNSILNNTEDTIVALSTPRGYSGIGVIRISGPDSETILRRLFKTAGARADFPDRTAVYGRVVDPLSGNVLDDGLAVLMKAPRSYTGEDMVELSLHGSPTILDMVLSAIVSQGARPAGRGEFSLRAFLSGRIDLVQAEAVIDLIESTNPIAAAEARSRLDGGLSKEIGEISDAVKDLLAELEAHIDFDDDDELPPPDPEPGMRAILKRVEDLVTRSQQGRVRREGVKIVIAGKPNVGKSTLFNRLLGTDRAIVTPYPGTTRDTLDDRINLAGIGFILHDTAGIRGNPDPIEEEGIRRSEQRLNEADLVLVVLDGSAPIDGNDLTVLDWCRKKDILVVLNKMDLGLTLSKTAAELGTKSRPRVVISAKTGQGVEALESIIADIGKKMTMASGLDDAGILNRRSLLLMEAAQVHCAGLIDNYDRGVEMSPEIVSLELRKTLDLFNEISGERVDDGILERIFERFCVGK